MKQTIEIEVPEGKKAVWKDDKIIFEDIAPELPETWEEFCENCYIKGMEYFIETDSNIIQDGIYHGEKRSSRRDKNILPSSEAAKAHLALMQLHQLRDCYRQGWVPDWKDDNSGKYCIEFVKNKPAICRYTCTNTFLSFQSQELAEKFLKNFIVLIKQAGDLI